MNVTAGIPWSVGVCAVLMAVSPAHAQTFGPNVHRPYESGQDFALELKVGPWEPRIDAQLQGRATPYRDIFGTDLRWVGALEFDWQIVRIGPVLSLGVGASAGYTNASARAPFTAATEASTDPSTWGERSAETTALNVIPTTWVAVARIDGLAHHVSYLPVVPYVKAGLAYSIWWVSNGSGLARSRDGSDAVGGSLGWHAAAGIALLLDVFEPGLARQWDATSGVNHSYVFFEGYVTDLSGFTGRRQLDVGTTSWAAGLALEF